MQRVLLTISLLALAAITTACSEPAPPPQVQAAPANTATPAKGSESFSILIGGTRVGQLEARHAPDNSQIEYEYRNNGRGPTIHEKLTIGELADFFLVPGDPTADLKAIKTISMVVKDGTFYFPSEIYPEFGIRPFVDAPTVIQPDS